MCIKIISTIFLFILPLNIKAQVVTTLPEYKWIVNQLAPKLEVKSLLVGSEDPHFVDASPAFVFKIAKAKLVIYNGLQLEVGWLPKVLQQSGNKRVQLGAKGNCSAAKYVDKMDAIENYDRSMGDVHPVGNPHYSLSPKQMIFVTKAIRECLSANFKIQNLDLKYSKLLKKLNRLDKHLNEKISGILVYTYHTEFNYLKRDYKLKVLQSLEEVPGVLPSAVYLSGIATKAKKERPKIVLASQTSSRKILNKFKELSDIDYLKLNLHPQTDYIAFIEQLALEINNVKD